jgi:hypothetical protein
MGGVDDARFWAIHRIGQNLHEGIAEQRWNARILPRGDDDIDFKRDQNDDENTEDPVDDDSDFVFLPFLFAHRLSSKVK